MGSRRRWGKPLTTSHSRLITALCVIGLAVAGLAVCFAPLRRASAAPSIGGIKEVVSCDTSALISFNTDVPAHAYIEYGTTSAYGSTTLDDTVRFYKEHAIQLTGLTAGIEYHYRIVATGGGVTTSGNETFETPANGNDCPAQPVRVDTRMPDMTGAVETVVKADCTGVSNCFTTSQFQTALNQARDATGKRIITVDAGLTLTGQYTFGNKADSNWIIVRSSAHANLPEGERVGPSQTSSMFKLTNTNVDATFITASGAHHWRIIGMEATVEASALGNAPGGASQSGIIRLGTGSETAESQWPHHMIFDRSYIHGQPLKNTTRGVYGNGTDWAVIDSYVSEFHNTGADAQAILSGQGRRVKIVNCYLESAGENFMSGGVDHTVSPVTTPSDFEFTHNYVAWKQSWKANDPTAEGYAFTADTSANVLTSTAHGFTFNYDSVRLRSTGSLPAPLTAGTDYYVRSTTTNTLQLGPRIVFTANSSTDTFTASGHGMSNGLEVRLETTNSLPSPLNSSTNYYVVGATSNTFQLATSVGGAAINITTNGSGTMIIRGGAPIDITSTGSGTHYLLVDFVTKNHFEIKTGKRALVFANVFDKWWSSEQTGGSIAIKSSDNDKDPTVVSKDITWYRNHHKNLGSGVSINGSNWADEESTDWTRNLWFIHNLFEINGDIWDDEDSGNSSEANVARIGPSVVSPSFRAQYPDGLRIVHNTFTNANAAQSSRQIHSFGGIPTTDGKSENFVVKDNVFGYGIFGIKCDGTAEGTASLDAITNSATRTWSTNLIAGSGVNYPTGNLYEDDFTAVKFVSLGTGLDGNYRLASDSPGKNAASDSTDIGADIDALERATESTIDGDWPSTGGGGSQDVVWTGLENATATGSSLQKTGGTSTDMDAGGYSTQSIVSGDGYVEFKKPSTTPEILIALSSDYDPSYGDSAYDYTIVTGPGGWAVYENGVYQTDGAGAAANDVFKIEITSGVVRYYRNGSLIDTSSQTVIYPVKLVCSIKTPSATITEAKIVSTGGGGAQNTVWTGLENATATGSSLQKTGGTSTDMDAGGYSTQSIASGDGYVEYKKPSSSTEILCALSSNYDPSYADSTYDYNIVTGPAGWAIYENGVYQTDGASVANNDVFKIEITSGVVRYYRNGSLIDTSSQTVSYPVKLVCSIKTPNGTITEAKITQ